MYNFITIQYYIRFFLWRKYDYYNNKAMRQLSTISKKDKFSHLKKKKNNVDHENSAFKLYKSLLLCIHSA